MLFSPKILDLISLAPRNTTRCIFTEGTVRSSKTASFSSHAFYYAVCQSNEKYHLIAGRNLNTIQTNILNTENVGLLACHPDVEWGREKIGSPYLTFKHKGKEKIILLCNYSDASSWKNVLGGTLGVILIDEINIADPVFVRECYARQVSVENPKLFGTLNGDDPTHTIYQEFINFAKIIGDAPSSIIGEMTSFQTKHGRKKGYYYMHFNMHDNPVMTEEKIKEAEKIYPVGSHYYKTKIRGERGTPGKLLFEEYMTQELIVNAREKDERGRNIYDIRYFSIGCDIGATRATNSIRLIGWLKDFSKAIILERETFKQCGYDEKKEKFLKFIKEKCIDLWGVNKFNFDGMCLDSAEQNFIVDMNKALYEKYELDVIPSYKATIKDRVDMMIIGFSMKRILFNFNCREDYEAYMKAVRSEKPGEIREDKNLPINDIMDSDEYGLTRHMESLMRGGY